MKAISDELQEELNEAYKASQLKKEYIDTNNNAIAKERENIKKLEWIEQELNLHGKSEEVIVEFIIKQMGKDFVRGFFRKYIPELKEVHVKNIKVYLSRLKEQPK